MTKVNHLDIETEHKDYSPRRTAFAVGTRLDVNDLIEKRKKEKKNDRRTNILIFSGVTTVATAVLLILYL
mgnify:CR=1 FL=1|tara:strand:+ start:111 stop:320 length:210 start_codon:yes stop_codon:yes gene_type:complete